MPKKTYGYGEKPVDMDQVSFVDIVQRVKVMSRAYEKRDAKNAMTAAAEKMDAQAGSNKTGSMM